MAWNSKVPMVEPCFLMAVKLHEPDVTSKPLPLIVPEPSRLRNFGFSETSDDEVRSRRKPSTVSRLGVDRLKAHGRAMVTEPPEGTRFAKSPESPVTCRLRQHFTFVAFARDQLLSLTVPPKSILPLTGAAAADRQMKQKLSNPIARKA